MDGSVPINGFCWSYANALLQKLISLKQEGRLFELGNTDAEKTEKEKFNSHPSPIASAVIHYLDDQFPKCDFPSGTMMPTKIDSAIALALEILEIFVDKP